MYKPARTRRVASIFQCSSASRKFLNADVREILNVIVKFQCSSASRKFLNLRRFAQYQMRRLHFSALQRAENSSMLPALRVGRELVYFSALQRAENSSMCNAGAVGGPPSHFSALQRAENSSIVDTR